MQIIDTYRQPKQELPMPAWQQIRMAKQQERVAEALKSPAERYQEKRMREIEEEEMKQQMALRERNKAIERGAYERGISVQEMAAIDARRRQLEYARERGIPVSAFSLSSGGGMGNVSNTGGRNILGGQEAIELLRDEERRKSAANIAKETPATAGSMGFGSPAMSGYGRQPQPSIPIQEQMAMAPDLENFRKKTSFAGSLNIPSMSSPYQANVSSPFSGGKAAYPSSWMQSSQTPQFPRY